MLFFKKTLKRWYKRTNRKITISKRQQLVIITLILAAGMILTQLVSSDYRYRLVVALSLTTYITTAFALREDLRGVEWITLLTLPSLFTAAVGSFYFLLPVRWLTRLPVALLYMIGIYALLLTVNIYNIAAIRTIALLRAAHSIGFLLTILTYYFLVQTVFAARINILVNILFVGIISFLLYIQLLWSVHLEPRLSHSILVISLALSIVQAQLAWILTLWPVNSTFVTLFLTTVFYSTAGLAQQYLQERLYKKTVNEFASVVVIIFLLLIIATQWR
ncbi:hypothetical protein A2154_00885 [Candidatus Gottesmanbacteria bacterium RBG_16_43_7]|uniref:Uncharacterized protein n=1 Tax=Candidatus Gottesmanbacteria bacterium RBG_16_43_7 TaxID=1798373 RepID=A0A1F5Z8Y8_9BACT|nr:MAG: hypothetical protein A2154_00885 [Candidatus Gottesmanbacteria bacterium RBG_16_43_7]